MKRRVIASLLTLVLCLTLLPAPAFAADTGEDTPEPAATDIYVSSAGDDTDGKGSQSAPYATLDKAVGEAVDGATIYVMSDLNMTSCARFYNKSLTITSGEGGPYTVTRSEGFATQNDIARSWYNPAMVEVQTTGGVGAGLTLTNIIFDDDGKHEGAVFAQAVSDDDTGLDLTGNTNCVQDAIIASNATVPSTITLGKGAVLRNFGGMSAVRATGEAKLVMEPGSVIKDTLSGYTRSKGTDTRSVGPAGAVWLQGSDFEMKSGAEIKNVNGRAIYADGGSVSVGGTISGITGNPAMWQGKEGTAIHLRGENASAVLASTAVIEEISGGGSAVFVTGVGNRFLTEKGSTIRKLTQTIGVNCVSNKNVQLNGEITEVSGAIPLRLEAANVVLGKDGIIHKNELISHGAAYVHNSSNLTIYGKINDNYSSSGKNAAALFIVNNGPASHATLEQGGEICNNTNGGSKYGAAVELQQDSCSFTMNGGTISGNSGPCGAVQVHKDSAKFIMNGGEVTGNTSTTRGEAGIYVENGTPTVELNAGKAQSVTLATNVSASPSKGHVYIADRFDLESGLVTMIQNTKTVTPAEDSLDIKLGNASTDSNAALKTASKSNDWADPFATFWTQRNGGTELTVGGLVTNDDLPVYVLTLPVDETGAVSTGAAPKVFAAQKTGNTGEAKFTLPDVSGNGCAVALVQPTTDFGSVVITGPATIEKDSAAATYEVPYTATYTMSDTLLNMLKRAPRGVPMTFVVELDSRLTAKKDDNGNFRYNFNGDGILEVDKSNITVSPDGHTITVVCKPVADWTTAIGGKTSVKMTLTGTGVLAAENFAAGEYLNTTGHIVGMIDQSTSVLIPANLCRTKMIGRYDVIFDWNDGSNKKKTVSVVEGGTVGDQMPADPSRSGYTFTGWNTKTDGTGNVFTSTTNVTDDLTVYAQWKRNGGGGGSTNYYLALKKVDAQDGHALSGAQFGLYQDGKQLATATSDRNGLVMFTLSSKNYKNLYCQELIAPEGYVMNKDKITVSANDLTTSRTTAEKSAETVRNYRGVTPDLLNDADHFAYVIGYPDGAVRPQGNITRAETATIFFRLLKDAVRNGNLLTSNAYQDVASSYWANTAISTMTGLGILQGRDSATFDPNAPITRAEFAAICARFDTGKSSGSQTFSDIRGHWAQDYIERAAELGWVKGFEDGTFRPNDCITRAQAMTMINRVLNRIPEDASDLLPDMNVWPDCNPGDWFYLAVQEATNSHNYKHKAGNYETWISMKQDPDWTRYEN